jgi:tRNA 2-thiouridine synthesizing protein E
MVTEIPIINTEKQSAHPEVDQEQFLCDFKAWSKDWAVQLARELGYADLSAYQWKIIYTLRNQYKLHETIPNQHSVCKIAGLDHFCLDKFFHNSGKEAWKIAGLPNPGEEIKAYL